MGSFSKQLDFGRKRNMWQCPKCGREFKRINQGHYCEEAPQTVLEYIDSQKENIWKDY